MSLLDKIKYHAGVAAQTAGTVAQTAVQQGKTLASAGRIKLAIAAEEDKLKKAYVELGRLYYQDHELGAEASPEAYLPWCDKAADAKVQIERLNAELDRLRMESDDEAAAEEPTLEVDLTASAEEPVPAEEAEEPAEVPAEPQVGTLYVDVTNTEE